MQTDLLNNYGKFHKETLRHLQKNCMFCCGRSRLQCTF